PRSLVASPSSASEWSTYPSCQAFFAETPLLWARGRFALLGRVISALQRVRHRDSQAHSRSGSATVTQIRLIRHPASTAKPLNGMWVGCDQHQLMTNGGADCRERCCSSRLELD